MSDLADKVKVCLENSQNLESLKECLSECEFTLPSEIDQLLKPESLSFRAKLFTRPTRPDSKFPRDFVAYFEVEFQEPMEPLDNEFKEFFDIQNIGIAISNLG